LVGVVAPAGRLQVAAVLAPLAQAHVRLASAANQQLAGGLAAGGAAAEVVLAQGVAE
jgi:hypothetical protein